MMHHRAPFAQTGITADFETPSRLALVFRTGELLRGFLPILYSYLVPTTHLQRTLNYPYHAWSHSTKAHRACFRFIFAPCRLGIVKIDRCFKDLRQRRGHSHQIIRAMGMKARDDKGITLCVQGIGASPYSRKLPLKYRTGRGQAVVDDSLTRKLAVVRPLALETWVSSSHRRALDIAQTEILPLQLGRMEDSDADIRVLEQA